MREDLKDIMFGLNKNIDMPLHEIHEIRDQYKGKEDTDDSYIIIRLLRARIAELEWLLDEANCMIDAAQRHLVTKGKGC